MTLQCNGSLGTIAANKINDKDLSIVQIYVYRDRFKPKNIYLKAQGKYFIFRDRRFAAGPILHQLIIFHIFTSCFS